MKKTFDTGIEPDLDVVRYCEVVIPLCLAAASVLWDAS